MQVDGVAPDKALDSAVLSRLKQFSAMNKLKKMALRVSIWTCHTFIRPFIYVCLCVYTYMCVYTSVCVYMGYITQ